MTHDEKVRQIAARIKDRHEGKPLVFKKGGVSHFVPNIFETETKQDVVDFKDLDSLLELNISEGIAVAESGLTFEALVRATLEHNLIPYVVPELKGITVGGAVSGCSLESMSYKLGGFHDSCLEYEFIDGFGEVRTCGPDKEPEVFHLLHGSYGTLGRLTKVSFKLLPAKPYVRMEYRTHRDYESFWADLMERCTADDYDFVDAIIHGPEQMVLCLGRMVARVPRLSRYDGMNIYYKSTATRSEDYLTTFDYFFRYDTECHWLTKTIPPLENKLVRAAIGRWFLGSTNLIGWSNRLKRVIAMTKLRPDIVVDVFIPTRTFKEFWEWYRDVVDFYPLWIVPYRMVKGVYPWVSDAHQQRMGEDFLIDAAIYGRTDNDPAVNIAHELEKKVFELGGVKTLISRNHYTEEEFWSIYSRPRISAMKQQLDPRNLFGDLYDKFRPERYLKR